MTTNISSIHNEGDNVFLDLLVEHPNLLEQSHYLYHDEFMNKASWGQIAITLSITVEQAQEKWRELCKYYVEESALRSCENNSGLEVEAMDKSSYDELYDRLHKIHETVIKTTTCSNSEQMKHSKATVNIANKKFFNKCTKKAKLSAKEFKEQLIKVAVVAPKETNLNSNIGELIETELQDMSPSTSGRKRTEILKLLTELNN